MQLVIVRIDETGTDHDYISQNNFQKLYRNNRVSGLQYLQALFGYQGFVEYFCQHLRQTSLFLLCGLLQGWGSPTLDAASIAGD